MNERIRELATQAGAYWHHGDFNMGLSVEFQEKDLQTFAELIVRECVGKIQLHNRMDEVTEQWVYDNLVSDVKEHFGVK